MMRKRIAVISVGVVGIALGSWYGFVELPRAQLIDQILDAGGRVEYSSWSMKSPFDGSRVKLVSLPVSAATQIETSRLLAFPALTEVGFEDQHIAMQNGTTVVAPMFRFSRKELPLANETISAVKEHLRQNPQIPVIDLSEEELEAFEASNDPTKWDRLLKMTEHQEVGPDGE